jgi:hypothetical protein
LNLREVSHERADSFGGVAHGSVEQVCVSQGGLHLRMTEKLTYKGQRCASGYEDGRESMTQIMDSQIRLFDQDWGAGFIENGLSRPGSFLYVGDKSCRLANRPPRPLDIDERLALRTAEYKPIFRIKVHGFEQLESRTAQRHTVDATLLGVSAGLDPDALFQVEHVPRSAEDFATAGAREQQQLMAFADVTSGCSLRARASAMSSDLLRYRSRFSSGLR